MVEENAENAKDIEPIIEHQLEERIRLQKVLCDLFIDLSPQAIVARKVTAIDLMIALASRQELQTRQLRSAPASRGPFPDTFPVPAPVLDLSPPLSKFPLVCEKTQCIVCIGNERLSYEQRMRKFRRVSHMIDHVEDLHLRHISVNERITCHHRLCRAEGLVLRNIMHFKNHVATVHKINLRVFRTWYFEKFCASLLDSMEHCGIQAIA